MLGLALFGCWDEKKFGFEISNDFKCWGPERTVLKIVYQIEMLCVLLPFPFSFLAAKESHSSVALTMQNL